MTNRLPLADLLEASHTGYWGVEPDTEDINVRVVRNGDVLQSGGIRWGHLPLRGFKTREASKAALRIGDLVITTSGYCGQVAYIDRMTIDPLCATNFVRVLRVRRNIADPRFLFHFMNSERFREAILPFIRGTAMKNLSFAAAAAAVRVLVPRIEEQRRIAAVLDQADELRAKRRASLALLDSLTDALFHDMFGDPVSNNQGWRDDVLLGDVADIASGITKGRRLRAQPTRAVPYLSVANVQDGRLELNAVKVIDATEQEINRYRLKAGDLLLTEGGDPDKLGRGTVWSDELPECIHQNHVFRVRVTSDEFAPVFLSELLATDRGRRYFLRAAKQTTGIASINKSQLAAFPVLKPPRELQDEFLRRLTCSDEIRSAHRDGVLELDALFASLQHRAFAGQL